MPILRQSNNDVTVNVDSKSSNKGIDSTIDALGRLDNQGDRSSRMAYLLGAAVKTAAVGLTVAGTGAVVALRSSIMAAADYEQSLNVFKSVSGATAEQMREVGEVAKQLGKDVTLPGISAKDAAYAMVELAKAGLSVNDTLVASKGVLALAKAGNLDTAYAAEVAANALNAFRMKGEDATKVADMLAAAANASSAGVNDLAFGLQMSSASASAMKVPLSDTVAILGAFANNGLRGSDAGTSLKTFMMGFTPTSKKAKEAMADLNLEFYNAKGNFVGMREAVKQLQDGTKNLTDEQKAMALETIFGSDAVRAANILVKEGVEGFDKMTKAVGRTGAATELAAAQNSGFTGALDNFKSTIETVSINLGVKLLPPLTRLLRVLADGVEPTFRLVYDTIRGGSIAIRDGEDRFAGLANALTVTRDIARAVIDYLGPKFAAVANTIRDDFAPAMSGVVKNLGTIGGAGLVGAIGLALDILNAFLSFISDNTWILYGLAAAFVAVKTAMLIQGAVAAFQAGMVAVSAASAATSAVMATTTTRAGILRLALAALTSPWQITLGIVGVAGVIAGLAAVGSKLDELMNKWNRAKSQVKVNGNISASPNSNTGIIQQLRNVFGRASGGPVTAGVPYIVGENPDGTLNNTSELFIPNQSGRILNASETKRAMSAAPTTENHYNIQKVFLQGAEAVDEFLRVTNRNGVLANKGMSLIRNT